jgi:hypothetical protein
MHFAAPDTCGHTIDVSDEMLISIIPIPGAIKFGYNIKHIEKD